MFLDGSAELSRGVILTETKQTPAPGRPPIALAAGALIWLAGVAPALAQSPPPAGVRAAGMAGAFTAVADDASASYWNPAGLASGPFLGLAVDFNALDRQSALFVGIGTPPFGISYFRERLAPGSTVPDGSGRNGVVVHHAGVTAVQSVGDHGLAVGATAGLAHGNGASAFDADAGVMLSGTLGRVGLTVHHVGAPRLGTLILARRVRGGLALHLRQDLLLAVDADLTATPSAGRDWRDAAVGAEAHPRSRLWLRAGVHWNTAGSEASPGGTAGGSIAVYGSLRVDAQVRVGPAGDRGWGAGLSFLY